MSNARELSQVPNITEGFKNRIINGDMRIDQRNAGGSVTPTDGQYLVDRWFGGLTQASKFSVQQNAGSVTPPVGFTSYLGATSLSAYSIGSGDTFFISQNIEGFNTADLGWGTANAKTVTLSFWVRSSLTGTFGGTLKNSAANRSYPFSYTISSANTWEQKSVTIAGDTTGTWVGATNGIGIRVIFSLGTGATFSGTAGSWQAGNLSNATGATSVVGTSGATFYITGVQLEEGSVATEFDRLPYGTQLSLCQRYYEVITNTNTSLSLVASYNTATQYAVNPLFKVTKRAAPTFALAPGTTWVTATPTSFGLSVDCAYIFSGTSFFYASGTAGTPSCTFSAEL